MKRNIYVSTYLPGPVERILKDIRTGPDQVLREAIESFENLSFAYIIVLTKFKYVPPALCTCTSMKIKKKHLSTSQVTTQSNYKL